MAHGKKYVDATRKFDRDRLYTPAEAFEALKRQLDTGMEATIPAIAPSVTPSRRTSR